jgi:hypothetical protein
MVDRNFYMKSQLKRSAQFLALLLGLGLLAVLAVYGARPWYSRWGATDAEIVMALPGDEFVPDAAAQHVTAVTIQAGPEVIYPWLLQLGAERGGFYSFTAIEGLIACPLVNADSIHPEWQNLRVGDRVKMCPGASGPPPYEVAAIDPDRSLILGHRGPAGNWAEVWQFVLKPIDVHSTRFLLRSRSEVSGGIWAVIDPGIFVMEQGLLGGVKERAERLQAGP